VLHPSSLNLEKLKQDIGWRGFESLFNWQAFAANLGWYLLSLTLYAVLPATEGEGTELRSGGRLKYKFNGKLHAQKICLPLPI
jgi:Delta14-sterol reductase